MNKNVFFVLLAWLGLVLAAGVLPGQAADRQEPYVIGPSDLLEILVWKEDTLTRKQTLVRPDGRLSMPLVDDVIAAGLTPMELKAAITKALERYVAAPKVYVMVDNPRSHNFSVLGNVMHPGNFPLLEPLTALHAIALAGGFNEWAHKDDMVILRGKGAEQKRLPVIYSEVIAGKKVEQNVTLEPGDLIIVP